MTLLEQYIGTYVQITIDPRTLTDRTNSDGEFCYVGKLISEDERYLCLSPVDVYRPSARDIGTGRITQREVVASLREFESRQAANVTTLDEHRHPTGDYFEDKARMITRELHNVLDNSTRKKIIPHSAVSAVAPVLY